MIVEALAEYRGWKRRRSLQELGTLLTGPLVVEDASGSTNRVELEVFVPREFPRTDDHPRARILSHDFIRPLTPDAHVGPDGAMCVQMPERNEINYADGGLLGFLRQVELHVRRARIWTLTTKYPGPEYAHEGAGRREYQRELPVLRAPFEDLKAHLPASVAFLADPSHRLPPSNQPCPCGSGTDFRTCHRNELKQRRARWRALGRAPRAPVKSKGSMLIQLRRFLAGKRKSA